MQGSIRLARILGVQVGLHYSWFLVFVLVTWSLGAVYFPTRYPFWPAETAWAAGLTTSALFFASVLVHELAHSAVAQRLGLEVESITLFIFGGMASITREAERARDEFAIAIAGPASSVVLGFLFGVVGWLALTGGPALRVIGAIAWWLATINLMLGAFNLIPGFPMDGGRVLRSLIWGATRNYWLATRIAAFTGMGIAYLMMLGAVFVAVSGGLANAAWLVLVGWFLSSAAHASYRQARIRESLKGVTVDQAMERDYTPIPPYASLTEVFEKHFQTRRPVAVPVVAEEGTVLGVLTSGDLRRIPRERWTHTQVSELLHEPLDVPAVAPGDQVNDVLTTLGSREFAAAPVVDGGRLVGLLTQTGILDLIGHRRRRPHDGKA
jgi:Zn-dependent protease/predicted transcriptional regulator